MMRASPVRPAGQAFRIMAAPAPEGGMGVIAEIARTEVCRPAPLRPLPAPRAAGSISRVRREFLPSLES
jgi:hypothetical protein